MAIIVVGGSNRGVGKTALVCALIAALPEYRWAAVKVTTHEHKQPVSPGRTNRSEGSTPDVSQPLRTTLFRQLFEKRIEGVAAEREPQARSSIWEDTVRGEDTDTSRYLSAGAARALLVTAVDGELYGPLNQLWPRFGRGTNLIFESNSVVHHVRPDVCLLIHAVAERELPLPERKPSFIAALRHADAMVTHARADEIIPEGLCLALPELDVEQPLKPKPIFHLRALERVSPEMLAWLRRRLPQSQAQHF
jgi:hypothetical protein